MLSDNLKKIRGFKNVSVVELARLSGISATTIWKIESDKVDPTVATVGKIAKALNEDIAIFFAPNLNFSQTEAS